MTPSSEITPTKDDVNWRLIAFYLGAPLAIATYETISDRFWVEYMGLFQSILFHLGHALVPWLITGAVTKGVMIALKRWQPNLFILTFIGAAIANVIAAPYAIWLTGQFEQVLSALGSEEIDNWPLTEGGFFKLMLAWAHAGIIWIVANYIFDRFLGLPRYRYDESNYAPLIIEPVITPQEGSAQTALVETPKADTPKPEPRFLERANNTIQSENILFLKAEEHYVQVCTDGLDELVLYRFSDAVSEMDGDIGFQVHRSYWVALSAIEKIVGGDRKLTIHLKGEHTIPVSARYQEIVRQRASAAKIKIEAP